MKSFIFTIATIIMLMTMAACTAGDQDAVLFGSSGSSSQPEEATATADATSAPTDAPVTVTATTPGQPEPTEDEEEEETPEPSPTPGWPDGTYTVTHDEGSMICESGLNETIPAGDVTMVTMVWQDGGETLLADGLEGQTMVFTRDDSGAGGFSMVSQGEYGGVPMTFTLYFLHGIQWIEGTIESEIQGCSVNRSFVASPN